jgi:spore germination protein
MLLNELGLTGVGYWNIMRPFPQNWLVLGSLFTIVKI